MSYTLNKTGLQIDTALGYIDQDVKSGTTPTFAGITNAGDITIESTGAGVNINLHSDAGDDFAVDTDKLVVEGDTGNVGIGLIPTARNNTTLQIKDGIGFPATQVASTDPNTLDDYEEGTWTPAYNNLTVTGTVTHSGTYVKNGRIVFITARITRSSGTVSGTVSTTTINNLPFPVGLQQAGGGLNYSGNLAFLGGCVASSSGGGSLWLPTFSTDAQNVEIATSYITTT